MPSVSCAFGAAASPGDNRAAENTGLARRPASYRSAAANPRRAVSLRTSGLLSSASCTAVSGVSGRLRASRVKAAASSVCGIVRPWDAASRAASPRPQSAGMLAQPPSPASSSTPGSNSNCRVTKCNLRDHPECAGAAPTQQRALRVGGPRVRTGLAAVAASLQVILGGRIRSRAWALAGLAATRPGRSRSAKRAGMASAGPAARPEAGLLHR